MKDIFFVKEGKSEYKIVLPEKCDLHEKFASEELQHFFYAATGVRLEVITDKDAVYDETKPYLSVGNTVLLAKSHIDVQHSVLKRDGYKIVSRGRMVFMVGGESYGTTYAVYGFLNKLFGYTHYAEDEIFIRQVKDLAYQDIHITEIPDIHNRCISFYYGKYNQVYATRMRGLSWYGQQLSGDNLWGDFEGQSRWAHNHISGYMPVRIYRSQHKDWYSPEFTQLCLSNREMWPEFLKRVQERIMACPKVEYFLLGQEDRHTFCGCKRCSQLIKKIGKSGILMEFINYIAREIKTWQKEHYPERNIYIAALAYQQTQTPPVKKGRKGNFIPLSKSVIPEDNVLMILAPIFADFSKPMLDAEYNQEVRKMVLGWAALTKNIGLWYYCSNFSKPFFFFDNLGALQEDYKTFKELQLLWFYNSNLPIKQGMAFQAMMAYVHSRLAWDTSLDLWQLIDDFMAHYYKEAAVYMKQYLEYINNYVKTEKALRAEKEGTWKHYKTRIFTEEEQKSVMEGTFWKYDALKAMSEILKQAEQAVQSSERTEAEKEKILNRIRLERFTVEFLYFEFCAKELIEELGLDEFNKMLDQFKEDVIKNEIQWLKKKETIQDTMKAWRAKGESYKAPARQE